MQLARPYHLVPLGAQQEDIDILAGRDLGASRACANSPPDQGAPNVPIKVKFAPTALD